MKLKNIILISLAVIIISFIGFIIYLNLNQKKVLSININDIDLNNYDDGNYTGTYKEGRWTNTVEITIKNHKIIAIKIIDPQTFRLKEMEETLISEVIEKQSLKVDVVSGATVSSKAILKAIENAFNK